LLHQPTSILTLPIPVHLRRNPPSPTFQFQLRGDQGGTDKFEEGAARSPSTKTRGHTNYDPALEFPSIHLSSAFFRNSSGLGKVPRADLLHEEILDEQPGCSREPRTGGGRVGGSGIINGAVDHGAFLVVLCCPTSWAMVDRFLPSPT